MVSVGQRQRPKYGKHGAAAAPQIWQAWGSGGALSMASVGQRLRSKYGKRVAAAAPQIWQAWGSGSAPNMASVGSRLNRGEKQGRAPEGPHAVGHIADVADDRPSQSLQKGDPAGSLSQTQLDPLAPTQVDPISPTQLDPLSQTQVDPLAPTQVDPLSPTQVDPSAPVHLDPLASIQLNSQLGIPSTKAARCYGDLPAEAARWYGGAPRQDGAAAGACGLWWGRAQGTRSGRRRESGHLPI